MCGDLAAVGGATQGILDLCDMLCSMRQYAVHVLGSVSFPSHPDMYEDDDAWEGMGGWKDAVLAALASLPDGPQQTQQAGVGTGGRGLLFRASPWQFVAGGPDGGMSEVRNNLFIPIKQHVNTSKRPIKHPLTPIKNLFKTY